MNNRCGLADRMASGVSLPIEPSGSKPFSPIGLISFSTSSRLYPNTRQHPVVLFDRMFHLPARSNLVQHDPVPSEPLFVRMFGGERSLISGS